MMDVALRSRPGVLAPTDGHPLAVMAAPWIRAMPPSLPAARVPLSRVAGRRT